MINPKHIKESKKKEQYLKLLLLKETELNRIEKSQSESL